ncbi:MAG: cytochrome c biogenesis CcdA family protein [Ktedonobacteraceae bacterium]
MNSSIFFGGSVLAAIIAGAIALFAPCCISVMLPAYFASSFQNRRLLVAMTFLFAGGIATIVLPIALGASIIRQLLNTQHTPIYVTGGILMLLLAVYVLLGGQIHLPMPGRRAGGKTGLISVYSLGIFSGIASSCCAPVLAGVIALSSIASSFWLALGLGSAYVFGMVTPLFVIALLWDRYDWRASRLFRPRSFTWKVGPVRRTLTATSLASGVLLALIGGSMLWVGLAYNSMPTLAGWQVELAVNLQHIGQVITNTFAWVPNWLGWLIFLAALAGLAWYALRQISISPEIDEMKEDVQAKNATKTAGMQEETGKTNEYKNEDATDQKETADEKFSEAVSQEL